jgi:hypothetical protein
VRDNDPYEYNSPLAGAKNQSKPEKDARIEKIKKIDMKTKELKKMEGMEDITNFFTAAANPAGDGEISQAEQIDRKKLEIIKKLNFRNRDLSMVFKHRRSQDRIDFDLTTLSGSIGDLYT